MRQQVQGLVAMTTGAGLIVHLLQCDSQLREEEEDEELSGGDSVCVCVSC